MDAKWTQRGQHHASGNCKDSSQSSCEQDEERHHEQYHIIGKRYRHLG